MRMNGLDYSRTFDSLSLTPYSLISVFTSAGLICFPLRAMN